MSPFLFFSGEIFGGKKIIIFFKKKCDMAHGSRVMARVTVPRIYDTVARVIQHPTLTTIKFANTISSEKYVTVIFSFLHHPLVCNTIHITILTYTFPEHIHVPSDRRNSHDTLWIKVR